MKTRPSVFLGLGSNLGDREASLAGGLRRLESSGFHVVARSSVYETEPVGGPPQGPFLNQVVRGETALSPEDLLGLCLRTEVAMGRVRGQKFGPRTLDLDILIHGDLILDTPTLTLPHPHLHERLFVLVPLAEVDPGALHPISGLMAKEMLAACRDSSRVVLYAAQKASA